MARKKDKFGLGGDGLDDFDDFDNWEDAGWMGETPKDNRKPITKLKGAFIEGIKDHFKSRQNQKQLLKKALPPGYGRAVETVDDAFESAKNLYDSAVREIKPQLVDLARVTNRLMPPGSSTGAKKKLSDKLKKFVDENTPGGQGDDSEDSLVAASLGQIFRLQAEQQEQKDTREAAEGKTKDAVRLKQYNTSLDQIVAIRSGMERLVGYQDSITIAYQKKSLEIQYRHYFVSRKLLEEFQKHSAKTLAQNDAVVRNTGLPEFVKIRTSEIAHQMMKQKFLGTIGNRVNDYFAGTKKRLKDNLGRVVGDLKGNVVSGLEQALMMAEMAEMGQGAGMSGTDLAGRVGGDMAGSVISNWVAKHAGNLFSKNKKLMAGSQFLMRKTDEIPEMMNEFGRSETKQGGWKGAFLDFAKSVVGSFGRDDSIRTDASKHLDEVAIFNLRTQLAITEVIPGWLARQHRELVMLRTGQDAPAESYDFETGKYVSVKEKTERIRQKAFSESNIETVRNNLDDLIRQVDPKGELTEKAVKDLKRMLVKRASDGRQFNFNLMAMPGTYEGYTDQSTAAQLAQHFQKQFGGVAPMGQDDYYGFGSKRPFKEKFGDFKRYGKSAFSEITDLEKQNKRLGATSAYRKMRNDFPDIREILIREVMAGNTDAVRALGITSDNGSALNQNYDAIVDLLLGGGGDGSGGGNIGSSAAAGPNGPGGRRLNRRGNSSRPQANNLFARANTAPTASAPYQYSGRQSVAIPKSFDKTLREVGDDIVKAVLEGYTKQEAQQSAETLARIAELIAAQGIGMMGESAAAGQVGVGKASSWHLFSELLGRTAKTGVKVGGALASHIGNTSKRVNSFLLGASKSAWGILGKAGGMAQNLHQKIKDRFQDIYVKGRQGPALLVSMMRNGEYIDVNTKKVITSIKDITGEVRDRAGNIIISAEEFSQGLYNRSWRPLLLRVGDKIRQGIGHAIDGTTAVFNIGKTLAIEAWKHVNVYSDVYVKGETTPRLLATIFRNGGYFLRETMKPIGSYADIIGPIVNIEGNVMLSNEDIQKGLVDSRGKPIRAVGDRLIHMGQSALGFGNKMVKSGLNLLKGAAGAAKNILGKIFGFKGFEGPLISFFGAQHQVVDELQKIRGILDSRLPGKQDADDTDHDGLRDGSWQAQLKGRLKRSKSDNGLASDKGNSLAGKAGGAEEEGGLFDGLMGKVGVVGTIARSLKGILKGIGWIGKGMWKAVGLLGPLGKIVGGMLTGGAGIGRALGTAAGVAGKGARLALGAGRMGLQAAMWGGRALLAAGSFLSAPVVLTAAAVGAVAVGGYFLYKYLTRPDNYLTQARFKAYGVDPTDKDKASKIAGLEKMLIPLVKVGKGQAATMGPGKSLDDLMAPFGISSADQERTGEWLAWFNGRFKPIFLSHMSVKYDITGKATLDDVDDVMTKKQMQEYLSRTTFPFGPDSPYMISASPFGPEEPLKYDVQGVSDAIKTAKNEVNKLPDKSKAEREKEEKDNPKPTYMDALKDRVKEIRDQAVSKTTDAIEASAKALKAAQAAGLAAAKVVKQAGQAALVGAQSGYQRNGVVGAVYGGAQAAMSVIRGDAKVNRDALMAEMLAQGIKDPKEQAMILAQVDHESGGFTRLEENLNYSAERLMQISARAKAAGMDAVKAAIAQGPEGIAELLYGGRMGNNAPGDGYRYRGRGLIMLTGKDNYIAASKALNIDLVNNPDWAADPKIAAKIALWYWKNRVGNVGATGDVKAVTKLVNGGYIGLEERQQKYQSYLALTAAGKMTPSAASPTASAPKATVTAIPKVAAVAVTATTAATGSTTTGTKAPAPVIAPPPAVIPVSDIATAPPATSDRDAAAIAKKMAQDQSAALAQAQQSAATESTTKSMSNAVDVLKESYKQQVITNQLLSAISASVQNIATSTSSLIPLDENGKPIPQDRMAKQPPSRETRPTRTPLVTTRT